MLPPKVVNELWRIHGQFSRRSRHSVRHISCHRASSASKGVQKNIPISDRSKTGKQTAHGTERVDEWSDQQHNAYHETDGSDENKSHGSAHGHGEISRGEVVGTDCVSSDVFLKDKSSSS